MDDQKQSPEPRPNLIHKNVLKPSQSFIDEMKNLSKPDTEAETNTQTDKSQPKNPIEQPVSVDTTDSSDTSIKLSPQIPSPSSIYPEAKDPYLPSDNLTPDTDTVKPKTKLIKRSKNTIITVLVIILGSYLALSALLGFFSSLKLLSFGFVGTGSVLYVIDIIYFVIGVGLILLKELARATYILLAIFGLFFSIYGTYHYFKDININNNSYANLATSDQQTINQYENNSELSSSEKQQIIQSLQQEIGRYDNQQTQNNKAYNKAKLKEYAIITEGYVIAIIPLIFLTRRSVKEIFS